MVELTTREKKIIMIKWLMHESNPCTKEPVETREKMLITGLKTLGIEYNKDEMLDMCFITRVYYLYKVP